MNKRLLCTDFCGCGPTWENADSDLILENANFPGKDDEGVKLPENKKDISGHMICKHIWIALSRYSDLQKAAF